MADPTSLALGAVSLAIQLFEGVKKGCEYFTTAANMPADCEALGWRLQIEYSKLLDWAESAGLMDDRAPQDFQTKLKVDPIIVTAVLSEMNVLLTALSSLGRHYHELQVRSQPVSDEPNSEPQPSASETILKNGSHIDIQVPITHVSPSPTLGRPPAPQRPRKIAVRDIDLGAFALLFKTSDIPHEKRKYTKGFNHIIELGKSLRNVGRHPRRIVWAVHDKEKFENTLKRLIQLTNYLHQTLGDSQLKVLVDQSEANCMALLQIVANTEETKMELLKAVRFSNQRPIQDQNDASSILSATTLAADSSQMQHDFVTVTNGRSILQESLFERLTRFSLAYSQILSAENPERSSTASFWLDDEESSKILKHNESTTTAFYATKYQGRDVWIEWKGYKNIPLTAPAGEVLVGASPVAVKQVKQLVALLQADTKPVEFSVPRCLGFFQDLKNTRFGFVYDLETQSASSVPPMSLLQMFEGPAPSIRVRIAMAQELAVTLLYLHAVNWVHKALRSASIVFFSDSDGPILSRPHISGFEYARPDQYGITATAPPSEFEWSVYCHPDYQRKEHKGFRKSYDMYSLGIIFLEIANWKVASELFSSVRVESAKARAELPKAVADKEQTLEPQLLQPEKEEGTTINVRKAILKPDSSFLQEVKHTLGDRFHNAVKACIQGEEYFKLDPKADQTDRVVSAVLQQGYMRLVVDALKSIVV